MFTVKLIDSGARSKNGLPVANINTLPNASGNFQGATALNPDFVNAAALDYHLLPSSAARDKGISAVAPADDIDGDARSDGMPDLGADETSGTATGLKLYRITVPNVAVAWKPTYLPVGPPQPVDAGWPRNVTAPGFSDDVGILPVADPLLMYRLLDGANQPVGNILRAAKVRATGDLRVSF